ncbi:hypothetical protein [Nocardia sp. CC227C]|uniref:hypothetical protein n=1 Tax=Nocardia sp. CC227C TaxID=3044562 RepID=UPI00278C6084|nr:hypothetical protein [Nocardia sp. CC227C]
MLFRSARGRSWIVAAVAVTAIAGSSVAVPAHATPTPERSESIVDSAAGPSDVITSYVTLDSPLPSAAGPRPEACDRIGYLRFRHADGPQRSSEADAIVTAQPGFYAGAASLAINARQVVAKAAAQGRHIEYWAISRRSNCLVDNTGLLAAERSGDAGVALDYYFHGKPVDGKVFEGFLDWSRLGFLRSIDQVQTIGDWRRIVTEAVPDPATGPTVFCGGHSYGGLVTSLLAGWDFDGDPATTADSGAALCSGGVFALDTLVSTDPAGLARNPVLGPLAGAAGAVANTAASTLVAAGVAPDTDTLIGATPMVFTLVTIAALAAYFAPDRESDLLRRLPHNLQLDANLQVLLGRSPLDPAVRDFRFTNAALFGALMDKNSQFIAGFQAGVGSFDGCPVGDRSFPLPQWIADIPLVGPVIDRTAGPGGAKVGPLDPAVLCGWRGYREEPQPRADGSPYETRESNVTDLRELALSMFDTPATMFEPYFPTMLQLDNTAFTQAYARSGKFANLLWPEASRQLPTLTVLGGEGIVAEPLRLVSPLFALLNPAVPLLPAEAVQAPHYRHADVVSAAAEQNDGEPEKVSTALADFIVEHSDRNG